MRLGFFYYNKMTNEEAKQQAIKNAYGEYWEQIKSQVDENGFIDTFKLPPKLFDEVNCKSINFRPKILDGLNNNNGWIRIENEFFWRKNNEILMFYDSISKKTIIDKKYKLCEFQDKEYRKRFTHYKIIEIPKPPIY